jgi:hypothetical protein
MSLKHLVSQPSLLRLIPIFLHLSFVRRPEKQPLTIEERVKRLEKVVLACEACGAFFIVNSFLILHTTASCTVSRTS